MTEANDIFGGISESCVKTRYFDRICLRDSQKKVNEKNPDEAMRKVSHFLIDLQPDAIHKKVQELFGRVGQAGVWTNLLLAELLKTLMEKYSRQIEF